ncbi:MAG: hypothetical protein HZB70_04135 [Candidatus Berkelbacteria bacterium]|nr:MAG: hypothetical protein HZB70_04135 [Candidatus Berkelbacteria bacterium]QQG51512.1 MAG: hypothetical protein HY845_03055 [Candidatus Berkelbacteria bacterium]
MLTIPHAVVGAALGSFVVELPAAPAIAFAAGWASHYVLDKIPHWENIFGKDIHGYPSGVELKDVPPIGIASGIVDVTAAAVIVFLVVQTRGELPIWTSPVFWGALGGFFPDLIDNIPLVNKVTKYVPGVLIERGFHERNHISEEARRQVPTWWGFASQLLVIIVGLYVLLT